MRGIPFRDGYHDFAIRTGGLEVYPRLVAADHVEPMPETTLSSDVPELDALIGDGLRRGSSTLLMGPAGVGKSIIATQYAVAAARRGETVALFIFDETTRSFLDRSARLGLDLRELAERGDVQLRQVDAAEFSAGEFTHMVVQAVSNDGASVVVIDSLSGYLNAMPEERFLSSHLHELLTYLSHRNVVTILTLAQHGILGSQLSSPLDISYLADTVLLLRYFEAFGAVRRAISVVKKRTGDHEVLVRELGVNDSGLHIGPPLADFEGVLTGNPRFTGMQARPLEGPAMNDARVVVWAPGRDGRLTCDVLQERGFSCLLTRAWSDVLFALHGGAGTLLVAAELLTGDIYSEPRAASSRRSRPGRTCRSSSSAPTART